MRARVHACLLVLLAVAEKPATAQPQEASSGLPLHLTVDTPTWCVDPPSLLMRVQRYAPRVREAARGEAAKAIRVEIEPDGRGFRGTLTVRDVEGAEGHRELRGRDCESVAAGLAFVAAIIMDPDAARAVVPGVLAHEVATAPAPPSVRPTSGPLPSLNAPSEPIGRLSAGAAIEVAHGLGPDPETIARLFFDFELSRWLRGVSARIEVGRGFAPSAQTPLGSATIVLTDARFEPCFAVWAPDPFALRLCGVVEAMLLSGQGKAATATSGTSSALDTVELGLALRPTWTIAKRVSVGLLAGAALPLARYRFYFTVPDTTVYQLPRWSAFGELSLGVYF